MRIFVIRAGASRMRLSHVVKVSIFGINLSVVIDVLTLHNGSCHSLSSCISSLHAEWADSWQPPCSFSLSPIDVVPMLPNLVSSSWVLGKGASVLKIQAFLLRVKLSSVLYCLEQLVECLRIQPSPTKYIIMQIGAPITSSGIVNVEWVGYVWSIWQISDRVVQRSLWILIFI
jgi:hypothetical protein